MRGLILVRGAGDLATGTIYRLARCGFPVLALEADRPTAIRRSVAFSEAVYDGLATVESLTARRIRDWREAERVIFAGEIPVLADPEGESIPRLRPVAVLDVILAKRNLGTTREMAPITVGYGPGFTAGGDVDAVVETMRGHDLGRVIYRGAARADTGIPGPVGGYDRERVIHAPRAGALTPVRRIGDLVEAGDTIARVDGEPVAATIKGVLRGMLRDGCPVHRGMKLADIDPRAAERENCFTISDKARALAGSGLEAVLVLAREKGIDLWGGEGRR